MEEEEKTNEITENKHCPIGTIKRGAHELHLCFCKYERVVFVYAHYAGS